MTSWINYNTSIQWNTIQLFKSEDIKKKIKINKIEDIQHILQIKKLITVCVTVFVKRRKESVYSFIFPGMYIKKLWKDTWNSNNNSSLGP